MAPISLVSPDVAMHASWLDSAAEFAAAGDYQHGSGLAPVTMPDEQVRGPIFRAHHLGDPARFAAYCAFLRSRADRAEAEQIGMVPDTKLWIVGPASVLTPELNSGRPGVASADDEASGPAYLGVISIRHELNDFLREEGGHIGYSVRPSARRRGVASAALREALRVAHGLGIERALVTCDDGNIASAATIERNGGVLEDIRNGKRRYWIDLPRS